MDSDTEAKARFSVWLKRQLDLRGWSSAVLIKGGGEVFGRNAVYRWLNGENLPKPAAARRIAESFGIDPREVFDAAGITHLMDVEGEIVVSTDPAEVFVARVRARGFPPAVEERLIEQVRRDIAERRAALDAQMDTVEEAQRAVRGDTDAA
jgi:transcriptional regulator with XRE-family HTH domain